MSQTCRLCGQNYTISPADKAFYTQGDLPIPQLCPACRLQRRMAFRNERTLYSRTCDLCQAKIISIHQPNKSYPVYCPTCWWSDGYDPLSYGRNYDFSKTFTEQFQALQAAVPHASLYQTNAVNSTYTSYSLNVVDSYMLFGAGNNEHCLYGKYVINSKDTMDSYASYGNELCYELVASERCYNCRYVTFSRDCRDCYFIAECQASSDCIMCYGLRSKQYYYRNQYVGPEKFAEIKAEFEQLTSEQWQAKELEFQALAAQSIKRSSHIYASEDCTGDLIFNSHDCHDCYDIKESEHCRYVAFVPGAKDSMDCTFGAPFPIEACYNNCSATGLKNCSHNFMVWNCYDVDYSTECHLSNNLFACSGLKNEKYCILNKRYSPEEYATLRAKIIAQMKANGEWGEFLAPQLSMFAYNETQAQETFPLNESQANTLGYRWHTPAVPTPNPQTKLCQQCGASYQVVAEEAKLLQQYRVPTPLLCFTCRHLKRAARRRRYQLRTIKCAQCQQETTTNYDMQPADVIYCEQCYIKTI